MGGSSLHSESELNAEPIERFFFKLQLEWKIVLIVVPERWPG